MANAAIVMTRMKRATAAGALLGLATFDVIVEAVVALGRDASGRGLGMQVLGYAPPTDLMMW